MSRLRLSKIGLVIAIVVLALGAGNVMAASFEFGGNYDGKGVHLHSQGRVNFMWVPITTTDPAGDPLGNMYWGAPDLNLFSVLGTSDISVGDSFSNLDAQLDFWVTDYRNLSNIAARDKEPRWYAYGGTYNIDSISFPSEYEIVIGGSVTNTVNNLIGSTLLAELEQSSQIDFTINIVQSSKTSMPFLTALKSGELSSWANISGEVGSGGLAAVPEPGTMGLMFSALTMCGWVVRKRFLPAPA